MASQSRSTLGKRIRQPGQKPVKWPTVDDSFRGGTRQLRARPVKGRDLLRDLYISVRDLAAKVVARELEGHLAIPPRGRFGWTPHPSTRSSSSSSSLTPPSKEASSSASSPGGTESDSSSGRLEMPCSPSSGAQVFCRQGLLAALLSSASTRWPLSLDLNSLVFSGLETRCQVVIDPLTSRTLGAFDSFARA